MTRILPERTALLDTVTFAHGSHQPTDGEMCVMEAVAYITGEPWSDHPQCVSPVIAAFLRNWNDNLLEPPRTSLLRPLMPLVIGTRTTEADEQTRAWMATDWLVRVQAPAWMELTPSLRDRAAELRALPPLTSSEIAVAVQSVLSKARSESAAARAAARDAAWAAARDAARAAAWDAAWAAARDAAWDAAWAAARDAARDAAGDAAWAAAWDAARAAARDAAGDAAWAAARDAAWAAARDAAGDAAGDAAWAAAWDAARAALAPTVTVLQGSAVDLVRRMSDVGRAALKGE